MVSDSVKGLRTEVQWLQGHLGPPDGVVVAPFDEGIEGVLAGVASRPMAAVMPECDGFGQRHVQSEGPRNAGCNLRNLEGVRQPSPLVVVGEHEDLGLPRQPAKRRGMEDPVAISLEARPPRIGLLRPGPSAGAVGQGGAWGEQQVLALLSDLSIDASWAQRRCRQIDGGARIGVGGDQLAARGRPHEESTHGRCPLLTALGRRVRAAHVSHSACPL